MRNIETSPMDDIEMIKGLCKLEAEVINMMFEVSEEHGIWMIKNSIQTFEAFLRSQNKMFIRGMSIEYRTFVVEILLLIDDRYRDTATAKVLMS